MTPAVTGRQDCNTGSTALRDACIDQTDDLKGSVVPTTSAAGVPLD